jgi:hypothetical protein
MEHGYRGSVLGIDVIRGGIQSLVIAPLRAKKIEVDRMRQSRWRTRLIAMAVLAFPAAGWSQAGQKSGTLLINGQAGQAPVLQLNGRSYVDIETLARLINGSLSFKGNQITLTLPGSTSDAPAASAADSQPANPGFSKDFMKAGIEEMSVIREWRSALVSAIQNGYPVTDDFVAAYRGQASTSLGLASVAISTDSDRSAFRLLSQEFDNMQKLSNKILAARKNMNYISPDAITGDPLLQKILNCARSLASMAASGQFQDDGSCN